MRPRTPYALMRRSRNADKHEERERDGERERRDAAARLKSFVIYAVGMRPWGSRSLSLSPCSLPSRPFHSSDSSMNWKVFLGKVRARASFPFRASLTHFLARSSATWFCMHTIPHPRRQTARRRARRKRRRSKQRLFSERSSFTQAAKKADAIIILALLVHIVNNFIRTLHCASEKNADILLKFLTRILDVNL